LALGVTISGVIRNIIFDWSGTLVDDLPAVWRATNYVLSQAGLSEVTLDKFRAEFSLPFTGFYQRYLPHVPMAQLETWFHGHFRTVQDLVIELPHAREFLLFCREKGLRTFVLSTVHRDHFATQASVTGFGEFIDRPYLGVWDKREKIHELLAENEVRAEETLFIGDMQHDIETARHGGVHSCAVLTGYNNLTQLRAAEPDLIVEHLGELRTYLERHAMEVVSPEKNGHPIVTVGGLVSDDANNVLMIRTQKWSHLWGIPGGKVKYGETQTEALKRELKEETNLEIEDIQFVMAQDCIDSLEFYRDAHFVLLNYTCRARPPLNVALNDEALEFRWVGVKEALKMELNHPTRVLLEAVSR
jgi:phosphoglycolate phosphatase